MPTGVPRQNHYGNAHQPWDDILDASWAPEFAAGNVLKYLRRTKEADHSLESARWYHARLTEMTRGELLPAGCEKPSARRYHVGRSCAVLVRLRELLTATEIELLTR